MSCSVLYKHTYFPKTHEHILYNFVELRSIDRSSMRGRCEWWQKGQKQMNCGLRKRRVRDQVDLGRQRRRTRDISRFWHTLNIDTYIYIYIHYIPRNGVFFIPCFVGYFSLHIYQHNIYKSNEAWADCPRRMCHKQFVIFVTRSDRLSARFEAAQERCMPQTSNRKLLF